MGLTFDEQTNLLPTHSVDNHCHVIDPTSMTLSSGRYAPFDASLLKYEQHLCALGVDRGVLVTASIHGTNNEPMLEALRRSNRPLRGIAVVDESVKDADLENMHTLGVRGLRLQDQFKGGVSLASLHELSARVGPMGWHIEIWTDFTRHLDWLPKAIRSCRVPVVLDHMGYYSMESQYEKLATSIIINLAREGHLWVTLSGAHRLAPHIPPSDAGRHLAPRAKEFVEQIQHRTVWGSDWPHVAPPRRAPTVEELIAEVRYWANNDSTVLRRLTATNNAALYGFDE